jgi:hypothetical protein
VGNERVAGEDRVRADRRAAGKSAISPSHLEMIASRENPGWVQVVAGWGCCRAAVRVCGVAG